jgi:aspartate aminotransferase
VHLPNGAFYLFADFSPIGDRLAVRELADGSSLCQRLLTETGVAILPGASFARPPQELTARLAYVNFDGARALAASEKIPLDHELPPEFTRQYCEGVLVGMERLIAWLGADP